jgi:hypothetical protein
VDLERSRLLLVWLQARRAVDRCLSDLLAAGPAGERRVREHLDLVDDLETRAGKAFADYRAAVATAAAHRGGDDWLAGTDEHDLGRLREAGLEAGLDAGLDLDEPALRLRGTRLDLIETHPAGDRGPEGR